MHSVVVIEKNRVAAQRIARILSSGCGGVPVAIAEESAEAERAFGAGAPLLLACDAADLPFAAAWLDRWPSAKALLWAREDVAGVLARVKDDRRFASVVGWPAFASIPRPWELLLATRRLVDPSASVPELSDLLAFGAHIARWRPRTTADRDRVLEEVGALAERLGLGGRVGDRLVEAVHELVMNAMYDAPVDGWGQPRYAQNRRADLELEEAEIPTLRVGYDGVTLAIEAADPFGRLRDDEVLDGILRGARNQVSDATLLDTRNGGAGLGLWRLHSTSMALLVEVRPLESTRVLWFFDTDVNPRDTRGMPASLHLFRTDTAEWGTRP